MLSVSFRVRRDRSFTRISGEHPKARLLLWCNFMTDVVEIQAPTIVEVDRIRAKITREHDHAHPLVEDTESRVLVMDCSTGRKPSVSLLVEQHNGILVPPIVCKEGWDHFRIFLPAGARLAALMRELEAFGPVEILSKRSTDTSVVEEQFLLSAADLLGNLTSKQSETLLLAIDQGYYDVPRRSTMQDIAKQVGRPRTTMEEQLRRAEGTIIAALAPIVALRQHTKSRLGRPSSRRRSP